MKVIRYSDIKNTGYNIHKCYSNNIFFMENDEMNERLVIHHCINPYSVIHKMLFYTIFLPFFPFIPFSELTKSEYKHMCYSLYAGWLTIFLGCKNKFAQKRIINIIDQSFTVDKNSEFYEKFINI